MRTTNTGYNIRAARRLVVEFVDPRTRLVACSYEQNVGETLMNERRLVFRSCAGLRGKIYAIRLRDPSRGNGNLLFDQSLPGASGLFMYVVRSHEKSSWGAYVSSSFGGPFNRPYCEDDDIAKTLRLIPAWRQTIYALYDVNLSSAAHDDDECDKRASPLFIDTGFADGRRGMDLTPPTAGILFDILGKNSTPRAHDVKRISWVQSTRYLFLVKPNAQGRVMGVDQMFGDNTFGPDGRFAADGFAALAKWDGTDLDGRVGGRGPASIGSAAPDGVINRKDAVYSELRLWADRDRNGVSSPEELVTLEQAGVVSIDLAYDPRYYEHDRFGNEVRLKSVVKYADGAVRLIFDLWFRYL